MTLRTQVADTLARAGWTSYSQKLRSGFTVVERSDGTVGVYYQHVQPTVRSVLEGMVRDKLIWYKETIEDTLPVLCFFEEPTSDAGTEWLWCFPQEGQHGG